MRHYLTLMLGERRYACDLARIQEIISGPELEPSLDGPELLVGIFDGSRGPLPVLDLLGRPPDACSLGRMSLVVLASDEQSLGLLADDLSSIVELDPTTALPLPSMGSGVADEFIGGVVEMEDTSYYVLDVDRVVTAYLGAEAALQSVTEGRSEITEP